MREVGKEMSEKSKGLFSPEDWICKSCGNINWARRNICNVCNTSRLNTLGQRTGYGGGFMERDEVVEYKRRGDSDDEFDEFGRKKKRFRKPIDKAGKNGSVPAVVDDSQPSSSFAKRVDSTRKPTATEMASSDKPPVAEKEEEDEEESGDDADLSKYDIWGDSDNEKDNEVDDEKTTDTAKNARHQPSPAASSGSDSDSDSSSSSSSGSSSSGSRDGSSGRGSRSSSASKSRSRSPDRASRSNNGDSSIRDAQPRTNRRRTSPRGRGHERSRSPVVAHS